MLTAAYDPGRPHESRQEAVVSGLFLMMGRGLERLLVRPLPSSPSSPLLSFLSLLDFVFVPPGREAVCSHRSYN